jgi:RNA polymerase sigma factor (sigma-70 family)
MDVQALEKWVQESKRIDPLAADVQQSTCLWFLEHQDEYKDVDVETQRIHQYARYRMTMMTAKRKHHRELSMSQWDNLEHLYHQYPSTERALMFQRALELIELAPKKYQTILIARYIYGYTFHECAKLFKIHYRTVHKYETIAIQRIKERLNP